MKEKTALKVRRFLPKKYKNKVEGLIVEYGTIVENFENGLIDFETAQVQSSELFKDAISRRLIAEKNVYEIMELIEHNRDTFHYLKEKQIHK
ncbi:hypothetical protein [Lentibacillus cibarius]|uniref:Uncharacterized protein n=1 Tax=Lentibacillus cibarius TaxID=2583219 RepID=A0A5S3QMW9_9BACI|nr:hypothetical protein [Lentibacillus cibarius]TMN23155.1 hypothetical protein FFL34_14455 [Lentibacillus cibarius]